MTEEEQLREDLDFVRKERDRVGIAKMQAELEVDNLKKSIAILESKLQRNKMPEERKSTTHKLEVTTKDGVIDVYVIIGFYADGGPGEIFVRCSTMGSTVSGFIDSWSIAVSLLLQHSVPLDKIIEKFANAKFEPLGAVKSGEVKFQASSLIDAIVRFLGHRYLGQVLR